MKRTYQSQSGKTTQVGNVFMKRARNNATVRYHATPKGRATLAAMQTAQMRRVAEAVVRRAQEEKNEDTFVDGTNIQDFAGSPILLNLSGIAQGDGDDERIGDKVIPCYLGGRYNIVGVAGAGQSITQVRIVVFQWKANADNLPPAVSMILSSPTRPFTYYNTQQTSQFKVLYDARHVIVDKSGNDDFTQYGEFNIGEKQMKRINFKGAATLGEGNIYLLAISDYTDADNAFPTMQGVFRLKYCDS